MAGWQDDIAKQKRAAANRAQGTPEYDTLRREAEAAEADVNASLRAAGQNAKY